jgi:hypothetical protein
VPPKHRRNSACLHSVTFQKIVRTFQVVRYLQQFSLCFCSFSIVCAVATSITGYNKQNMFICTIFEHLICFIKLYFKTAFITDICSFRGYFGSGTCFFGFIYVREITRVSPAFYTTLSLVSRSVSQTTDESGFDSRQKKELSLLHSAQIGPPNLLFNGYRRALCAEVKTAGRVAGHSPHLRRDYGCVEPSILPEYAYVSKGTI